MAQRGSELNAEISRPKDLKIVLGWLSPKRKAQLGLLLGLSTIGAVAELATLGAVLPFLMALADPDQILDAPLFGWIFSELGWTNHAQLILASTLLFVATVLGAAAIRLALTWATAKYSHAVGHDLSVRLVDRVLHQPYSFHTSTNSSEVIAGIGKAEAVVTGVLLPRSIC